MLGLTQVALRAAVVESTFQLTKLARSHTHFGIIFWGFLISVQLFYISNKWQEVLCWHQEMLYFMNHLRGANMRTSCNTEKSAKNPKCYSLVACFLYDTHGSLPLRSGTKLQIRHHLIILIQLELSFYFDYLLFSLSLSDHRGKIYPSQKVSSV